MKRIAIVCAALLCAAVSSSAARLTEEKGEGLYGISAGKVSMVIDAGKGAKILSFKYEDQEIISQIQRFNAFGATFWTSPQSEWNWPPVAEYDRLPYEVELGEDRIVMNGKVSEKFGYSIRKEFVALPEENVIQVNYSIVNHSSEKRKVAPWEISRVLGKELEIRYQNDPNSGHYQVTPYAFMPRMGRKLVPPLTVDLGQGILRVMEEEHRQIHPELQSQGGYLVSTDD